MISSMNLQIIRLSDVQPTSWKNGGGTTRELVAWPNAEEWKWRASVAEVAKSGPFSSFPDVQRWFAVLSGDGVSLTVDGQSHELRVSDPPLRFDGAAKTHCELLGDATQDFNLMVQGGATARMQRVCTELHTMVNTPKIIAIYAGNAKTSVLFGLKRYELEPNCLGWMCVDESMTFQMCSADALLMEITL